MMASITTVLVQLNYSIKLLTTNLTLKDFATFKTVQDSLSVLMLTVTGQWSKCN